MSNPKLTLEFLNGPLDEYTVTLDKKTDWSKEGTDPLSLPWDKELGMPQARFFVEDGNWWLEGHDAPHGTYCVNRGERIEGKTQLKDGDVLKASGTWLLVKQTE